ncbi:MAG: hypothetical protein ACYC0H_16800 [Solirubrobacteraceae bacterium]
MRRRLPPISAAALGALALTLAGTRLTTHPLDLALLIVLELYALTAVVLLIRRGRAALGATLPVAPLTAAACLIALLA